MFVSHQMSVRACDVCLLNAIMKTYLAANFDMLLESQNIIKLIILFLLWPILQQDKSYISDSSVWRQAIDRNWRR